MGFAECGWISRLLTSNIQLCIIRIEMGVSTVLTNDITCEIGIYCEEFRSHSYGLHVIKNHIGVYFMTCVYN